MSQSVTNNLTVEEPKRNRVKSLKLSLDKIKMNNFFKTTSAPCGRLKSHNVNGVQEGKPVAKDQFSGRSLGVFTSGGDSQGMNATVRAIVRMGLYLGCNVYLIHEVKKSASS